MEGFLIISDITGYASFLSDSELEHAEHDFQIPASLLWDYITRPESRSLFMGSDKNAVVLSENDRLDKGSVYTCAHGNRVMEHTIVDWQPFEQYTTHETLPLPGAFIYCTYRLVPVDGGTRLTVSNSSVQGPWVFRLVGNFMMLRILPGVMEMGSKSLEDRILEDVSSGKTRIVQPIENLRLDIPHAVKTSFEVESRS